MNNFYNRWRHCAAKRSLLALTTAALTTATLTTAALTGGCQQPGTAAKDPTTQPLAAITQGASVAAVHDATASVPLIFNVRIFMFPVPMGTFSGNEDFWKRIDEQCVDVPTYDLLYKNGIRVGEAPLSEMNTFAKYMDGLVALQDLSIPAVEVRNMEVAMKAGLPEETLFYFDRLNNAVGQSYEGSDNVLNVSFEPAQRKPGQLRLTFCPMVRSTRQKLHFTAMNIEQQIPFILPERLYDLNFRVDLPPQNFLVITPSPDAQRRTSIGNAFFTKDSPTQRMEQVIIITSDPVAIPQNREPAKK